MKNYKMLFCCILMFLLTLPEEGVGQEEMTLTTYYPAPYGDYCRLLVSSLSAGDSTQAGFREVSGLKSETEIFEYRDGDDSISREREDGVIEETYTKSFVSADSFFDVFTEVILSAADTNQDGAVDKTEFLIPADSFFDIFIEISGVTRTECCDSFFDVFVDVAFSKIDANLDGAIDKTELSVCCGDSFFDIFVEIDLKGTLGDTHMVEEMELAIEKIERAGIYLPDVCPDADSDSVIDGIDNCPSIPNPDQSDLDTDGLGDVCDNCPNDPDNDADQDGICGDIDSCPLENPQGLDADLDGCIDTIEGLYDILQNTEIQAGVKNSLLAKVSNALSSLTAGEINAAINILEAFINQVEAQRGKKILERYAEILIKYAENIIDQIETQLPPPTDKCQCSCSVSASEPVTTERFVSLFYSYSMDCSNGDCKIAKAFVNAATSCSDGKGSGSYWEAPNLIAETTLFRGKQDVWCHQSIALTVRCSDGTECVDVWSKLIFIPAYEGP